MVWPQVRLFVNANGQMQCVGAAGVLGLAAQDVACGRDVLQGGPINSPIWEISSGRMRQNSQVTIYTRSGTIGTCPNPRSGRGIRKWANLKAQRPKQPK